MTIHEKLAYIQYKIKVPKGQWNDFSKFHFRSCEDILFVAKPFLEEKKAYVTLNDEIVCHPDNWEQEVIDKNGETNTFKGSARYYVKATATIFDTESAGSISVVGYARESAVKKGMDDSQITGSTSSYARKLALSGLFAIDNEQDPDGQKNAGKRVYDGKKEHPNVVDHEVKNGVTTKIEKAATEKQIKIIKAKLDKQMYPYEQWLQDNGFEAFESISSNQAYKIIANLMGA